MDEKDEEKTPTTGAMIPLLMEEGCKAMTDKDYASAVEAFTRVMHACPCNRGARRCRCTCKSIPPRSNIMDATTVQVRLDDISAMIRTAHSSGGIDITTVGSDRYPAVGIFVTNLYGMCACPAREFGKCDADNHVRALDLRAAAFEKLATAAEKSGSVPSGRTVARAKAPPDRAAARALARARSDAEWLVDMAPRRPEGWLRLGKVLRVCGERIAAYQVLTEGIVVAELWGDRSDPRLRKLRELRDPLHRRYYRVDMVEKLPPELITSVFEFLSTNDALRCLRVSKTWNKFLPGIPSAWRSIDLNFRRGRLPSKPQLQSLTRLFAGKLHTIRLAGVPTLPEPHFFQTLIVASAVARSLSVTVLDAPCGGSPVFDPLKLPRRAFKHLTHLTLIGVDPLVAEALVPRLAGTLTHLTTDQCLTNGDGTLFPRMEKLESLRLRPRPGPYSLGVLLPSPSSLVEMTPNIKRLTVHHLRFHFNQRDAARWPRLEALRLSLTKPPLALCDPATIRVLDLAVVLSADVLEQYAGASSLRAFRLGDVMSPTHSRNLPRRVRAILEPAVLGGTLGVISLSGIGNVAGGLTAYGWLAGCPSLTVLELRCWGSWDPAHEFGLDILVEFIHSFPSLKMVAFGVPNWAQDQPWRTRDFCTGLERLMMAGRVAKICVDPEIALGVMWNHLRHFAAERQVEFVTKWSLEELGPLQQDEDVSYAPRRREGGF